MDTDMSSRSISSVLGDIVQNVQEIVGSELRLAKTEIGEEIAKAQGAGVLLGSGVFCGFFAVLFALLAAMFGLSRVVPNWAAALIVAIPMGVAAGLMYSFGRKRFRNVHPIPDRTVETVKESVQWAIQRIK